MIQEFVNAFTDRKSDLEAIFANGHPNAYEDVVKAVISIMPEDEHGEQPDVERIHEIDDGDYQGTLVYVIGATGYQPFDYWYVRVYYGSCSGCDTLESIRGYEDYPPSGEQVKDYMTLALHIVQGLKKMGGDAA